MAGQLTDRVALITGASRGIGRSMAELFAREGAAVALVARSADALDEVAATIIRDGGRALALPTDLVDPDAGPAAVERARAELGGIDILVNNAGGSSFMAPIAESRMSGVAKTMALNFDATLRMIQAVVPGMTERGRGSIVNVSSVTALRASPLLGHYGAAKAAVVSITQTLGVELGPTGVRVNALVPGWIATDLTEFLRGDDALEASILDRVPMHRWGTADEIAQAALFLASDASSFMTGQSLVVDGGLSANP